MFFLTKWIYRKLKIPVTAGLSHYGFPPPTVIQRLVVKRYETKEWISCQMRNAKLHKLSSLFISSHPISFKFSSAMSHFWRNWDCHYIWSFFDSYSGHQTCNQTTWYANDATLTCVWFAILSSFSNFICLIQFWHLFQLSQLATKHSDMQMICKWYANDETALILLLDFASYLF